MRYLVAQKILGCVFFYGACSAHCLAAEVSNRAQHFSEIRTGVVFPEQISIAVGVCKTARNCWTPSKDDIEILEMDFAVFLKESKLMGSAEIYNNLSSYKRKYYGFTRKGKHYVQVNGLCKKYWKPESVKFNSPDRLMTDMGSCYFLVDYDVKRRAFSDFYIDGD